VRGLPASRSAAADSFACRSARQLSPDGGQPAGRGRVYELIPDLDGNTAYDRGIYHDVQVHPVHLNVVIDPSVVGGISVQIGDELIDGTAASRLAAVRRKLAG